MTEKSQLENLKDVQLFYLLKTVGNEHHPGIQDIINDRDIIEDSGFLDSCESAGTIIGLSLEYPIDPNYIAATIRLNADYDFNSAKPSGPLKRPEGAIFSFDIDEYRIEHVRRSYTHKIRSYSRDLVKTTIGSMLNEGSVDIYDGAESDADYYDGETTDIKIDKHSIRFVGT